MAVTVILILVVLLCLYMAIQVMTTGHASLFGFSLFRVVTGSMEPTIPVGTLLVSRQTEIENVTVGDIVCFYSKDSHLLGRVITHRVTEVLSGTDGQIMLQTQGDANATADFQYVTQANLIGKVIYYVGEGNLLAKILSFFTTEAGFLGCIVFPCLIIAGVILKDCVKNIRKDLDQIVEALDAEEAQPAEGMTPQEYKELAAQIRAELTEELKQGAQEQRESE